MLRRWATRYAPEVATDGSDGLIADITGAAHLFGGEKDLYSDLHSRLERAGLAAKIAIAGTRGAAHAVARHGGGVIPEDQLTERLGHLPVRALRIDQDTESSLNRVGLVWIADLISLPRAPLVRRYGPELMQRLDQMLGTLPEPVSALREPPHFGVRMTLPEPIGLQTDVMAGLTRLLDRLCETLAFHRMGARRMRLELSRVDRGTIDVEVGLARPLRDPARIAALFATGVDEVDAGYGIDALRLSATVVEELAPEQTGNNSQIRNEDALADLISRIGNRIGFDNVLRYLPAESLIPERSFLLAPAAYSTSASEGARRGSQRPITIFPPEPIKICPAVARLTAPPPKFRWRRMELTTHRASGPERIAPEWWFDDPAWRSGMRDYWRIETAEGPRLWLFHTPQTRSFSGEQAWFAQGEFA